ncbi:MAG TPA: SxtJ family membrane protein [Nitrospirota bacterium]|nr:SxtJ family membrane protein [Nitrospirota bacterium]
MVNDITKEFTELDRTPQALRNFGLLFFGLFGIVAGVMVWKGNSLWPLFAVIAGGFLLAGAAFPRALVYPYLAWMAFALLLGWVITRLVLTTVYYIVMTPIGLVLRIAGKDMLDQKIDKGAESYWKKHEAGTDLERYRKQF